MVGMVGWLRVEFNSEKQEVGKMKKLKLIASLFMLVAFFTGTSLASNAGSNSPADHSSNQLLTKTILEAVQASNLDEVVKQELTRGTDLSLILEAVAFLDHKDPSAKTSIESSIWDSVIKISLASGLSLKDIFKAGERVGIDTMFIAQRLVNIKTPATVVFAAIEQSKSYANREEALAAFNVAMTEQKFPTITMDDVNNAAQGVLGYTPPPGLNKNPAANRIVRVVLPPAAASSNPNAGSFASPSTF